MLLITSGELLVLNIILCSSIIYFRFFFIVSTFLLRSSVNRSRVSFIVLNILTIAALVLFQHLLIELISIHCLFCTEWLGFPVSSYVRSFWIVSYTLWMTNHWDSVPIICFAKEFHVFLYRLLTWLNSNWSFFFFFPCSCLFSLARAVCCLSSVCIWITQGSARNVECIYRTCGSLSLTFSFLALNAFPFEGYGWFRLYSGSLIQQCWGFSTGIRVIQYLVLEITLRIIDVKEDM